MLDSPPFRGLDHNTTMHAIRLCMLVAISACQPLAPTADNDATKEAIAGLEATVANLTTQVTALERTADAATRSHTDSTTELETHSKALARVEGILATLPDMLKEACPPTPRGLTAACEGPTQRIPTSGDKMLVGVREHITLVPPAVRLVARIDTNAAGNYLLVRDVEEFQRDGNNWVRFTLPLGGDAEPVAVERQIVRRRTNEDSKDAVIRLRMTLGDVTETYDFTLLTRRARDYQVRLGRSFLKDIALVDVSKRFIQPRPGPIGP